MHTILYIIVLVHVPEHLGVISILGIMIVSCDRLLERDWCAPYGARATRAVKAYIGPDPFSMFS